jgi:hypothetical protein
MSNNSKIYGVDTLEFSDIKSPFENLAQTPEEWKAVFEDTRLFLTDFLEARDPFEVIAKSSTQRLAAQHARENGKDPVFDIEQADVEILQTLTLMQRHIRRKVPTSPSNFERLWPKLSQHVFAFNAQQPLRYPEGDIRESVIRKARLQTVYYRNIFTRTDCERAVISIFGRIDHLVEDEIGFRPTDLFKSLLAIVDKIQRRLDSFTAHYRQLWSTSEPQVLDAILFFCKISPTAARAWMIGRKWCVGLAMLQWAGIQLSELCNGWAFRLEKDELRKELSDQVVALIERLSIQPGELADENPAHIYMNNPIWRRPFINFSETEVFLPIPHLVLSFPFRILSQFLEGNSKLEDAYSAARSKYLEDTIAEIIRTGLPHAEVHRNLIWHDDDTGKNYENDVVASIGNTIFLFEAKSGQLSEIARRGGDASLIRNFRELFVEPGEQAWRLENYLNTKRENAKLWRKDTGEPVALYLDKPKIVHKFSICFEHLASLTSTKQYFKALGLVTNDSAWAPLLSLGELHLIWRHLDSEVSLFHYLTRRATLEDVFDFEGDEQDILSLYLIDGLCLHSEKLKGRPFIFKDIDRLVRQRKTPHHDRTLCAIYGVKLTPYWLAVVQDVYEETIRHRFDILQVILNQDPHSLAGIEQVIGKWKTGAVGRKKRDLMFSKYTIGSRTFALAVHLVKHPLRKEEWIERARNIAHGGGWDWFKATDCVVLMKAKFSDEWAYDAVSFFRLGQAPKPSPVPEMPVAD